jgi:hypothetical protein
MAFVGINRAIISWQNTEAALIKAHGHYVTIYYKERVVGSSSQFDSFLGESMDPKNPETRSGVTTSTGTAYVVSGIIFHNPHGMSNEDATLVMPIGEYEPDSVIFKCIMSHAIIGGVNKFDQSKYVVLNTDPVRRYQVLGTQKDGLGDPYLLYVHLGRSTVEAN